MPTSFPFISGSSFSIRDYQLHPPSPPPGKQEVTYFTSNPPSIDLHRYTLTMTIALIFHRSAIVSRSVYPLDDIKNFLLSKHKCEAISSSIILRSILVVIKVTGGWWYQWSHVLITIHITYSLSIFAIIFIYFLLTIDELWTLTRYDDVLHFLDSKSNRQPSAWFANLTFRFNHLLTATSTLKTVRATH